MKALGYLVRRNGKLFFKDKGMFFSSMITPIILLVLFITFLGNVYRDSLYSVLPEGITLPESLVEGFVGGWLFSSLMAVCCVTVAFCANMQMVQDKVTGARRDLMIAPVKPSVLSMSYYLTTVLLTLFICLAAFAVAMIYLGIVGWYLSAADIGLIVLDIVLLVLFGTALSSVICHFLSTQGQMSAVGTIISAGYGFICGAYMPISQFSGTIQKLISFLPGTYGTALMHRHLMRGVLAELERGYLPKEAVSEIGAAFDNRIDFLGHRVEAPQMYLVLAAAIIVLVAVYVLMNRKKKR